MRICPAPREVRENVGIITRLGDQFRLVQHNQLIYGSASKAPAERCNTNKLACNLSRAKSAISAYCFNNSWEYFFTGTLDAAKQNREDFNVLTKKFPRFIRDTARKSECKINYLIVPELHRDGSSWHCHGVLSGVPPDQLRLYGVDDVPNSLKHKFKEGKEVFYWRNYADKFGINSLEKIMPGEITGRANYLCGKVRDNSGVPLGRSSYYKSAGLKKTIVVARGILESPIDFDYSDDFCSIVTTSSESVVEEWIAQLQRF